MSVVSVAVSKSHDFSKTSTTSINLIAGLGVEGDCHLGKTVQHRSRLHIKPSPPNLRQVHLIPYEVLHPLGLHPSQIGENVTTRGIDLLSLSAGTKLHFVSAATADELKAPHPAIILMGLRNPCPQIEKFRKGLQEKFVVRDTERKIVARRAGVMCTVEAGGKIVPGMKVVVEKPAKYVAMECV